MKGGNGRTALALAFGEHPGHCCGVRYGADKDFFRGAILPFLDEQAVRKGKKIIIIHEFNIGFDLSGADRNNPGHSEVVRNLVQEAESRANGELRNSLDAGEMPKIYRDWLDWGYLERIAEINRANPGRIRNIVEPLRESTVWRMWDQSSMYDRFRDASPLEEKIRLEIEVIRQSIGICLERSRRVVSLVKEMREKEPGAAFVIPRGYAHKGMAEDFDFSDFEKTVAFGLKGAPHFSSEAIAASFSRELGQDELRRYAVLSMRYNEYMRTNGCRIHSGVATPEMVPVDIIWKVSAEARRYALESVG